MLIYVKLSWRVFGIQQKWCLMMPPKPSPCVMKRGTREWMYIQLREGIIRVVFYNKQNFLQIFEIYDVSNNWNVRDMSVGITWSTFFKATTKLLIHILYFSLPSSSKFSLQRNNDIHTFKIKIPFVLLQKLRYE